MTSPDEIDDEIDILPQLVGRDGDNRRAGRGRIRGGQRALNMVDAFSADRDKIAGAFRSSG